MKKYTKISFFICVLLLCLIPNVKTEAKNFPQNSEKVEQTADEELTYQLNNNKKLVNEYNTLVGKYIKAFNKYKKYKKNAKAKVFAKKSLISLKDYEDLHNYINKRLLIANSAIVNRTIQKDIKEIRKEIKRLNAANKKLKREALKKQTRNPNWKGSVLNKQNGVVKGPMGKETYYNLNMSTIVKMMKSKGYDYDYWVRDDGCKMFGDYIMVAANLKKYPKGTIVQTSLGEGIVCDTGGFVHNGSGITFDIATSW